MLSSSHELYETTAESNSAVKLASLHYGAQNYTLDGNNLLYVNQSDLYSVDLLTGERSILIGDYPGGLSRFFILGDLIVFTQYGSYGYNLLALNAPGQMTFLIDSISNNTEYANYLVVGDKLLFSREDPEHGTELWISDGTTDGTALLFDVNPGSARSFPKLLKEHEGFVYFSAEYLEEGRQLFRFPKSLIVDKTTSIESNQYQQDIWSLSPNPTSGIMNATHPDKILPESISVFTLTGTEVMKCTGVSEIDLSDLPSGGYIIKVVSGEVNNTQLIYKQ